MSNGHQGSFISLADLLPGIIFHESWAQIARMEQPFDWIGFLFAGWGLPLSLYVGLQMISLHLVRGKYRSLALMPPPIMCITLHCSPIRQVQIFGQSG